MGLTGIMIIDDGSDTRLDLPRIYGVDDLPIILQDRSIDSDGSIGYDNNDLNALDIAYGARGDTIVANGAIAPTAKVPAGLVRLRLLNAANAQNFDLRFKDGRTFHVIASDGGFLTGSLEAIARLQFPQNVACGFPALRSSAGVSQHCKSLQLRIWEAQPWFQ
jgi:FtsP/CotA-like multicopper oxidase with cupredoxin domain